MERLVPEGVECDGVRRRTGNEISRDPLQREVLRRVFGRLRFRLDPDELRLFPPGDRLLQLLILASGPVQAKKSSEYRPKKDNS